MQMKLYWIIAPALLHVLTATQVTGVQQTSSSARSSAIPWKKDSIGDVLSHLPQAATFMRLAGLDNGQKAGFQAAQALRATVFIPSNAAMAAVQASRCPSGRVCRFDPASILQHFVVGGHITMKPGKRLAKSAAPSARQGNFLYLAYNKYHCRVNCAVIDKNFIQVKGIRVYIIDRMLDATPAGQEFAVAKAGNCTTTNEWSDNTKSTVAVPVEQQPRDPNGWD